MISSLTIVKVYYIIIISIDYRAGHKNKKDIFITRVLFMYTRPYVVITKFRLMCFSCRKGVYSCNDNFNLTLATTRPLVQSRLFFSFLLFCCSTWTSNAVLIDSLLWLKIQFDRNQLPIFFITFEMAQKVYNMRCIVNTFTRCFCSNNL